MTSTLASRTDDHFGFCVVGETADGVKVGVTFAPDTTPEYVRGVMAGFGRQRSGVDSGPGPRFNARARWTATAHGVVDNVQGNVWVSFSFVPDGTAMLADQWSSAASSLYTTLDSKFGGDRNLWRLKIEHSFWPWNGASGVQFINYFADDGLPTSPDIPGAQGTRGDTRIGARSLDGQGGVLAYAYYPNFGEIVLDSNENWGSVFNDYRYLRNILAHEVGHTIGLGHAVPCSGQKLMEPFINTGFDTVQHDDALGANYLYSDRLEGWNFNDTIADASGIGTLDHGFYGLQQIAGASTLSISRRTDKDFFKFRVAQPSRVRVSVHPVGFEYNIGNQVGSGCDGGTSLVNSRTRRNLNLWLRSSFGWLAQSDTTGHGGSESVTSDLGPDTDYFIEVGAEDHFETQLYEMTLDIEPLPMIAGSIVLEDYPVSNQFIDFVVEIRALDGTLLETHEFSEEFSSNGGPDSEAVFVGETGLNGLHHIDVRVPNSSWLRTRLSNVEVPNLGLGLRLVNGDINGDNTINIGDFLLLRAAFGSSIGSSNWNQRADLNGSGSVNIQDFAILRKNFGRSGG